MVTNPAQNPDSPAYESKAYLQQVSQMEIVRDFCAGIRRLRELGRKYLAPFPKEKTEHYGYRLAQSLIFNDTERTVQSLVGRVFRKEPVLGDDVPEMVRGREEKDGKPGVEGQAENVDLAGAHWTVFAKELFTDAIRDGHSFIFVDMPAALPDGATLADEVGRRPYWVRYRKDQAINWHVEMLNGKPKLLQITFKEITCEREGQFGQKEVTRYRVLRPGSWELWRKIKLDNGTETVVPDPDAPGGATSLRYIPLAVIYSNKTGYLESCPPLEPLAQIECARFNKYSDFSTGLHLMLPVLCRKGANPNKPITEIGWHTVMETSPEGDIWYAESNGHGLEPMRDDIQKLDDRMSIFGLSLLSKQTPAPTTATEALLTNVKEDSPLATAAQSLKDGLEQAFKVMADYQRLQSGGSVKLGVLGSELAPLNAQAIQALSNASANGQLSRATFLTILKEAGWTPESFDLTAELARLESEQQAATERQAALFDKGFLPAGQ